MDPSTQLSLIGISSVKKSNHILESKAKQGMVEMGGRIAQILGVPRSTGQIFGLLYFSSQPLSLGNMCNMLGISKASISTGTRQLSTWGAIRKVWIPGERKDYYEAVDEFGALISTSYRTLIKPRISSSSNRLEQIEQLLVSDLNNNYIKEEEKLFIKKRLDKMKKFHGKITKISPFIENLLLKSK